MPEPDPDVRPVAPLLHRVSSWCGVALGVFLLAHIAVQARAIRGERAMVAADEALGRAGGLRPALAALVLAALLVHGAVGAWQVATRAGPEAGPLGRVGRVTLRATGAAALGFAALHLADVGLTGDRSGALGASILAERLSALWHGLPAHGLAYLVGAVAVVAHVGLGSWAALARSPLGATPPGRRAAAWAVGLLAGVTALLAADVVVMYATGARLVGSESPPPVGTAPCPEPEPPGR